MKLDTPRGPVPMTYRHDQSVVVPGNGVQFRGKVDCHQRVVPGRLKDRRHTGEEGIAGVVDPAHVPMHRFRGTDDGGAG